MRNRKMMIAAAAAAVSAAMTIPAFAQGWTMNGNNWYFIGQDGNMVSESWQASGNDMFYLGYGGAMEKNSIVEYRDHVYYVNEDGAMVKDSWRKLEYDGEEGWMYFGPDGRAVEKGWKTIGEKKYHFTDHLMDHGWFENESTGARYYLGTEDEGWIQQGWAYLDEDDDADKEEGWYYIKSTGKYVADKEEKIDGVYYVFNATGKMMTNWVGTDSGTSGSTYKYYDSESGGRADGWHYIQEIEAGDDSELASEEGWYYFKGGVPYSAFYKTTAIADGGPSLKFASGANVTVNLAGRTDLRALRKSADPRIVAWTAGTAPDASVKFKLDDSTRMRYALRRDESGLSLIAGGLMVIVK